ncbi:hypothetical protein [Streptomyces sp. NPDC058613]|uniref:hypothetical protein n=1 Tax=unclassified Streptomyces TaxID=2593676 RepID=UPI00364871BE
MTIRQQASPPRIETFRLVTSLLDHRRAPARQLATAYHQRGDRKRVRGTKEPPARRGFILPSKAPD